jgi:hypothetical protein
MPTALTIGLLQQEAVVFARAESKWPERSLRKCYAVRPRWVI